MVLHRFRGLLEVYCVIVATGKTAQHCYRRFHCVQHESRDSFVAFKELFEQAA
jgi:hypothetical protein